MSNNLISTLKTIENKLRRDANMSGQIDYNEQIAWMLFLKSLDLLEEKHEVEATFAGKSKREILEKNYRWSSWIKKDETAEGKADFIKNNLFPYMRSLLGSSERELIAQVFGDIPTKLPKSPFTLAEVLDLIDSIDLNATEDTHVVSQFYEESLQKMGSQGRQAGGEFYTPRPIIRLILKIINPKIGETILDPFMGSAGFLAEGFLRLKNQENLTAKEYETLQYNTFFGQELKPIPFLLGTMNCILHGLYGAKLLHKNSFADNIRTINPEDKVDIVTTNPPFGAEVEPTLLENFPYPTSSTQVLAVQYILRRLKPGGRCGMVVDEGFLSRINEKAFANTKKELLEENNLFAVVSLPQGTFTGVGTGVKTNLVFFERGRPTKETWYYELLGKFTRTQPIKDSDLEDCAKKFKKTEVSDNSWLVKAEDLKNLDLSAKNPNGKGDIEHKSPKEILKSIQEKETKISTMISEIKKLFS
jgi:type I restriction enzyme M protein